MLQVESTSSEPAVAPVWTSIVEFSPARIASGRFTGLLTGRLLILPWYGLPVVETTHPYLFQQTGPNPTLRLPGDK